MHGTGNTFLSYQYEWICFSCGYNVKEQKNILQKLNGKETKLMNRLNNAVLKVFVFALMYIKH